MAGFSVEIGGVSFPLADAGGGSYVYREEFTAASPLKERDLQRVAGEAAAKLKSHALAEAASCTVAAITKGDPGAVKDALLASHPIRIIRLEQSPPGRICGFGFLVDLCDGKPSIHGVTLSGLGLWIAAPADECAQT